MKLLNNGLVSFFPRAMKRCAGEFNKRMLRVITHVKTREKIIALTFDDGPHPIFTPLILDILEKYNARATFFVVGSSAVSSKDIMKRTVLSGHEIGNHSWSHVSFPLISSRKRMEEINLCDEAIYPFISNIFRPPYGHFNACCSIDLLSKKRKVIGWNVAAEDWKGLKAKIMFEYVTKKIHNGSILLMHDSLNTYEKKEYESRYETCRMLEMILQIIGKEYRFVTVSELLKYGKPVLSDWRRKADPAWISGLHKAAAGR